MEQVLGRYRLRELENLLRKGPGRCPVPPVGDRTAWGAAAAGLGSAHVAERVGNATAVAAEPVPPLSATLWLEFERSGVRTGYEEPYKRRRALIGDLAVAECLRGDGTFLDPVLDLAWAICEESSWAFPAHYGTLTAVPSPHFDLGVAETALLLAELDSVLGERLPPELGRRIRDEVDRRCLTPLLERHDQDWLYPLECEAANWTAVCCGAMVGAALHLEPDPARLAELVARVARPMDDYLATFDRDGGSSEGILYWGYGFGHYVQFGHLLEHATGGELAVFDSPRLAQIARFPLRTRLSPGRYVSYSDGSPAATFPRSLLTFLARRMDLPALADLATEQPAVIAHSSEPIRLWWKLRDVLWAGDAPPEPSRPLPAERTDWFGGLQWLISRRDPADPDGLVLAAKAGHNAEMHNHNDVGTIIVHAGGESLVADLGRGVYSRSYFDHSTRYSHFLTSSRGHSVPLPNGEEQVVGAEYRASDVEHSSTETSDELRMELSAAYPPEADLASLRRTVSLHRPDGVVELRDEARFSAAPGDLVCPLITTARVVTGDDGVVELRGHRGGLRVTYEPAEVAVDVADVPDVVLPDGPVEVRQVRFTPVNRARDATVHLIMSVMPD